MPRRLWNTPEGGNALERLCEWSSQRPGAPTRRLPDGIWESSAKSLLLEEVIIEIGAAEAEVAAAVGVAVPAVDLLREEMTECWPVGCLPGVVLQGNE